MNRTDIVANSNSKIVENSASAFAEYVLSIATGNIRAGLRYEYVAFDYYKDNVHMPGQSRQFHNMFPNIQYDTQIGNTMWQFSYSTKIQRPSYSHLSDNVSYSNRFTLQSGNPLLNHQTDHKVGVAGVWDCLQWMLEYKDSRNAIIYWAEQMTDNPSMALIRYKNEKSIKTMTAFIAAAPKIGIWEPQFNLGISKQWLTLRTEVDSYQLNKPLLIGNVNNAFNLSGGIMVGVDFAFQGKGNYQNAEIVKNQYVLDVSLRKSFLQNALTIELKGYDLLYQQWDSALLYNHQMQLRQLCRRGTRQFAINLRYRLNTARSKYKGSDAGTSILERL